MIKTKGAIGDPSNRCIQKNKREVKKKEKTKEKRNQLIFR